MRQAQALSVLLSGANVFLTGPPGAGKTYVLNDFIARAQHRGKNVAVTASTGIAATHLNGTTIHSWSGLGIRDGLTPHDIEWLKNNAALQKRYNTTDILVIDEISMLHGTRLDMVNQAAKILRENDAAFGGMQVVLVGDLFQLPPVTRDSEVLDFAHLSQAWQELDPKICYITEQHRQTTENDPLLELLTAMRAGELTEEHGVLLTSRQLDTPHDIVVTRLYTHNLDVDAINQRHLVALNANSKTYHMSSKGAAARVERLKQSVLAPEALQLKTGAEVMFVANNFGEGFANGTRGQVVDFHGHWPVVRLYNSERLIIVQPHTWSQTEDGRVRAEVSQLPLRLAWAITIHKSQGMSLDAAEIDLSQAFTPGMGYVALSRVRSLDGIYLRGLNRMALQLHPAIFTFDAELKRQSAELAQATADAPAEPDAVYTPPPRLRSAKRADDDDTPYDEALFELLRAWRTEQATAQSVPPYVILHDSVLKGLARRKPQTLVELTGIKGLGPAKINNYGKKVLAIIADYGVQ